MVIEFCIHTKPVPQARPRFKVRYRGLKYIVSAYDTKKCKEFKEVVAWHAKIAMEKGPQKPLKGPISISLTFQVGKRNGTAKYPTKRPDIDNLAKAVKDALNGIIFEDDSQIVEAHLKKKFGDPLIRVKIKTLEENNEKK